MANKTHFSKDGESSSCGLGKLQMRNSFSMKTNEIQLTTCQKCLRAERKRLIACEFAS